VACLQCQQALQLDSFTIQRRRPPKKKVFLSFGSLFIYALQRTRTAAVLVCPHTKTIACGHSRQAATAATASCNGLDSCLTATTSPHFFLLTLVSISNVPLR
jgi:hypothetical protein